MKDRQTLFSIIDALSPNELEEVYQHVKQRRQVVSFHRATGTHNVIDTSYREPAETIRAEVNALIDEAIETVRHKHETQEAPAVAHR